MATYSIQDKLEWTVLLIHDFAQRYGLTMKQAFNYLSRFKGIDFADVHYGYAHTQSFNDMVEDISVLCKRMGGRLG